MDKWLERGAETDVHMFPVVLHLQGVYRVKKHAGVPIGTFLMFFRDNHVQYLIQPGAFMQAGQNLYQKMKDEKEFVYAVTQKMQQRLRALLRFSSNIHEMNLSEVSNQELAMLYREWSSRVVAMMEYGGIAPVMEWEESLLSNDLNQYLTQKLEERGESHKLGEYLNVLMTPTKELWITKEQRNLHKIAVWVAKHRDFMEVINRKPLEWSEVTEYFPTVARLVEKHVEKFHWVYFNYEGPMKREDYFLGILRQILTDFVHPRDKYLEIRKRRESVASLQSQLYESLVTEDEYRHLFEVAQELSYQKGMRRDLSFKAYWQVSGLINEISRRTGLTINQVRTVMPHEIENVLSGVFPDLNARLAACAVIATDSGFEYLTGETAQSLAAQVDADLAVKESVTELKGQVAYPGMVTGTVRIIQRKEDMAKMQRGDVLVSSATNPELVPAMKLAAAIVTDEGGITCHAAIVSRELRIPCVVGTKIASRALVDGLRVAVDANTGNVIVVD